MDSGLVIDENLIFNNMVISNDYNKEDIDYKVILDDRNITTDHTYMGNIYNRSYVDGFENKSIIDDYAYKDICTLGNMDLNSGVINNIEQYLDNIHIGENSDVMFFNNPMSITNHRADGDLLYSDDNSNANKNNNTHITNCTYTWNGLDFNKASRYTTGRYGFEDILMSTHIYF
jgi:hypothetical protein